MNYEARMAQQDFEGKKSFDTCTIEKVYGHPNQTYNFQLPCRMYGFLENELYAKNDNLILMTL